MLVALTPLAQTSGPYRPAWIKPQNGVRFPARDAVASRSFQLPGEGRAFYLFTRSALKRTDIARLSQSGLQYLGAVTVYGYAFLRTRVDNDQRALLSTLGYAVGTAAAQPTDRLDEETLPFWTERSDSARLPFPLHVSAWPKATRTQLLSLLPEAAEQLRLPNGGSEPLMEESALILDAGRSTVGLLKRLARAPIISAVRFEHPKKPLNAASRSLSNANALSDAPYQLTGTGVLVGHWDGGSVFSNHGDFGGRVTNREGSGVSSHATHTAGTILGSGAGNQAAGGFAPGATMIAYDFFGNASSERRAAKHAYYHEHDNHSWGSTSTAFGGYDGLAQTWDVDGRDLFLMGLKAAGNEGSQSQVVVNNYGFDSLSPDSTSKNVLVIGATSDDGDLTGFSSRGPTNDGRIKPDLSGNGQNLRSTWPGGGYANSSGTSMSTPSVTGMVTLLAELFKREHSGLRWAPDMVRTVLIHTVTDVFHYGPDYRHGWGNADAEAAAALILQDVQSPGQRLIRGAVRDGDNVEYIMDVPTGAAQLKVTTSWLDAFQNSTAQRRLLNNVDVLLISPSGNSAYPWTLDPANPFDDAVRNRANEVDNVEQVLVEDPEPGEWTIRVSGTEITDPDLNVQGFVMATSHPVQRSVTRVYQQLPPDGEAIPDGNPAGLVLDFNVAEQQVASSARLRLDIQHEARGNIRILMRHPDGTEAIIETEDGSNRRDLYAVFPDTRSYDEDITRLFNKSAAGTWQVQVIDTQAGQTGVVRQAVLEIDLAGAPIPPPANMPPAANAGKDESVSSGELVQLDGSDSLDPEGQPLQYAWQVQSGPAVTLSDASLVNPTFTAPDLEGTRAIVLRLTVTDNEGLQSSDDVNITVIGQTPMNPNKPPVAITNGDQIVPPNTLVLLDASGSSDPDSDPLTFQWQQIAGPGQALMGADQAIAQLTTPDIQEGTLAMVFQVQVEDPDGEIDLEEVLITVAADAPPPMNMPPQMMEPDPQTPTPTPGDLERGGIEGACGCTQTERSSTRSTWLALLGMIGLWGLRRRRATASR